MRYFRKLVVWAALGVYAFGLAELCIRWMTPVPLMPRYITGTPWGVRGNIPGASYRHVTPEVDVRFRINSQGMRANQDFSLTPEPHLCRIAMIGDSFFMGYELDLPDTVAAQLEQALSSLEYPTEVLNFSVSGLGTAEMLRTYESYMRKFTPDVVLMQWHRTDIDDNLRSNLYTLDGEGVRRLADSYLPAVALQDRLMKHWLYRFLSDHSQLYTLAREGVATAVKKRLVPRAAGNVSVPPVAIEPGAAEPELPGLDLAAALVREFQAQVEKDGHVFLAVDIPDHSPAGISSTWPKLPPERVREVPVVHADEIFRHFPKSAKLYFEQGQNHLTPIAAKALAEAVAKKLQPQLAAGSCGRRLVPRS
jgi:hypothetical protein